DLAHARRRRGAGNPRGALRGDFHGPLRKASLGLEPQHQIMKIARSIAGALLLALALPAAAANFLWEVKSVTNRIYLFGTVHAAKQEWYPLPAAVEEAYADSAVLVVEADVTDKAAMDKTAPLMIYTPPDTLKNHVEA